MSSSLNLSLTDELRSFVDAHSGDGTLYATPSEFVRDLLRQRKSQLEAQAARNAILEGYHDALAARVVEFDGHLLSLLKKARKLAPTLSAEVVMLHEKLTASRKE
jgi:antitoxin ParD1/3/4